MLDRDRAPAPAAEAAVRWGMGRSASDIQRRNAGRVQRNAGGVQRNTGGVQRNAASET